MARPRLAGGSREKLRRLQAITDAALAHLGLEDLLAELLDRTRDLLAADTAAILLLDPADTELIATAASGLEQEVRQGVRLPVGRGFAGRIAAEGQPLMIEHVDHTNVADPILLSERIASVLGVPMINSGRVIGVLHIGTVVHRRFTDDDIELLQLVADRAVMATQARMAHLDRAATLALQGSLLPARPRSVPGLNVAARYIPGAELGVGGDWYDLFTLPTGHTGIVIGDVAGSGLHAAVVMGRIRSALRAYALETTDPADVLTRLDRKMQLFEPDAMATVIYGVLDLDQTTLTLSNAGHLPPIALPPGGLAETLSLPPDLPIGAYRDAPRQHTDLPVRPGTGLFLYTDGLVERHDQALSVGIKTLQDALRSADPDTMCATAMAAMLHDQPATDDVAALAIQLTGSGRAG